MEKMVIGWGLVHTVSSQILGYAQENSLHEDEEKWRQRSQPHDVLQRRNLNGGSPSHFSGRY